MANNKIVRKNWVSSFTCVGEAVVNDYTFKIDEQSQKSSWIYNSMSLNIDCGEKAGSIRCDLMGGYSPDRDNIIYAHGKDENGNDDFTARMEISWDDRDDDEIIEQVGRMCFFTVGLEKTTEGKTYYKNFLSAYDTIAYINKHLESGMVVRVTGQLKYSKYNDNVQVRKEIKSIVLSRVEGKENYSATFTQSVLLDKDSASLKNIDKDKSVMYVDGRVLDYVSEVDGIEVKGQYPFNVTFEYPMDFDKADLCKKIYDKLFKIKKNIRQVTFEGSLVESGAVVTATKEDIPDDIKDLIELGIYTWDDALDKCSTSGARERRMVLTKPLIRKVGEEGIPTAQIFDDAYEEEDLEVYVVNEEDARSPFDGEEDDNNGDDGDELDWLSDL